MKAILVIDMPKIDKDTKNGCRNCRYADCGSIGFFESYKCVLTGQCTKVYEMKCPLKPLKLGEELCKFRNAIKDKNTLIGFNMAVAICNKYLGEEE